MISIIALESAIEPQDHEIGDLIRGLLGKDTIVRLTDAGRTTVAEVVDVCVAHEQRAEIVTILDRQIARGAAIAQINVFVICGLELEANILTQSAQ